MTTPAHCTRTWRTAGVCPDADAHYCSALDSYHHVQHVCVCGNVEPPARVQATPCNALKAVPHPRHDNCPGVLSYGEKRAVEVQATLDPRLDVVQNVVVSFFGFVDTDCARTILDALDAMRPDEMSIYDFVAGEGWTEEQRFTPAPAGLSAAQEIRLEVFRSLVGSRLVGGWTSEELLKATHRFAAEVEHGPDETPELREQAKLLEALQEATDERDDYARRLKATDKSWIVVARQCDEHAARADLAEARLGHIADALRDLTDPLCDEPFETAVRECLAWTPDDDAPAVGHDKAGCTCWDDTAPADAATGDGS